MRPNFYLGKHVISSRHFDVVSYGEIFRTTEFMKKCYLDHKERQYLRYFLLKKDGTPVHARILTKGKGDKPAASTRTVTSMQDAFTTLGGIAEWMPLEFSSMAKGEDIWSTARNIGPRLDCIAIRDDGNMMTPWDIAHAADKYGMNYTVINLGNGNEEHPTQTFADLFTIQEKKPAEFYAGKLAIALVGDLPFSRTIKSLIIGLANFGATIYLVAPMGWELPSSVFDGIDGSKLKIHRVTDALEIASEVDVWYFTRLQKNLRDEELSQYQMESFLGNCSANERVRRAMKDDAIVLHPQPTGPELDNRLDLIDKRFVHNEQSENGFYGRMALLKMLFAPQADISQIALQYGKVQMRGFFNSVPVPASDVIALCLTKDCPAAQIVGNGWRTDIVGGSETKKQLKETFGRIVFVPCPNCQLKVQN